MTTTNGLSSRHRSTRAITVVATLLLLAVGPGHATTKIPYPEPVRRAIEDLFLADGRPSPEKIEAARGHIEDRLEFIEEHKTLERRERGEKKKKAKRKAQGSKTAVALRHSLDLLDRLAVAEPAEAYRLGAEILTIDFAVRVYHYPLGSIQMPIYVGNMLVDWSADSGRSPSGPREASNLVDPETGGFFTEDELDEMIARDEDLSRLDPPGDGMLWRPVEDIASLDIRSHYLGGHNALHDGQEIVFPDDGEDFLLKKVRMTQTKPKIDVYWWDEVCREEATKKKRKACRLLYKLKFGAETHSDPVVNALMAAVGYNVDVSMHTKGPRVHLGDVSYEAFRRDWENYFGQQDLWTRIDLEEALLPGDQGRPGGPDGDVLVFREAGIEAKPERFFRIGGWSNGLITKAAIAAGMREARGLATFNVWVANTDLKDAENNKVILRYDDEGELRMFLSQQDAGNALGLILAEKADAFPWDVVEQSWLERGFGAARGRIELNYFAVQRTGVYKTATYADHRWVLRLIAQLTREQIEDAVALGRWPGGVGELYVEKLINRRNQLVQAFGLSDEFPPIPVDRKITTADGTVKNGKLVVSRYPDEASIDFGQHWRSLARPVGPILWRQLRAMVGAAIGAIDSVGAEVEIDGDLQLYPDALINLKREVVPNPSPEGELDQFIVEDSMKIGFRLGVGTFGQGRVTLERRYRLAYSVPSEWDGRLYRNQALNWFLPIHVRRGNLPERYVLLRVDEAGPGAAITSPDPSDEVTGGADVGVDWLFSRRLVLDARPDSAAVWLESGQGLRGSARAWLKIFPLRISFFDAALEGGWRNGEVRVLERRPGSDDALDGALHALRRDDSKPVRALERSLPRETDLRYVTFWREIDLIFLRWTRRDRRDWIDFSDHAGNHLGRQIQSMRNRFFEWKFLDNGEAFTCSIEGYLNPEDAPEAAAEAATGSNGSIPAGPNDPVIIASYLIDDKNTHSDELDRYYAFLQGLGGGRSYMAAPFAARDWEQTQGESGRWGRLFVESQLVLREEALRAAVELDADVFLDAVSDDAGVGRAELRRARRLLFSSDPHKRRIARRRGSPAVRRLAWRSEMVVRSLRRARAAENPERRLARVVHAVMSASCRVEGDVMFSLLRAIDFPKLVKKGHGSVRSEIGTAVEDETKLPERSEFVGRMGKRDVSDQIDVIAEPFDPIELYDMLDWARGEAKRSFVAPEALR